ncbi:MAG: hypothetical protein DRQ37_05495, partial [Gammaproteobacteria bacterium]
MHSTTLRKSLPGFLRARLQRCPDTEPEQAMLRVVIGTIVLIYLTANGAFNDWRFDVEQLTNLVV